MLSTVVPGMHMLAVLVEPDDSSGCKHREARYLYIKLARQNQPLVAKLKAA